MSVMSYEARISSEKITGLRFSNMSKQLNSLPLQFATEVNWQPT